MLITPSRRKIHLNNLSKILNVKAILDNILLFFRVITLLCLIYVKFSVNRVQNKLELELVLIPSGVINS